jgi:hypothetical protein
LSFLTRARAGASSKEAQVRVAHHVANQTVAILAGSDYAGVMNASYIHHKDHRCARAPPPCVCVCALCVRAARGCVRTRLWFACTPAARLCAACAVVCVRAGVCMRAVCVARRLARVRDVIVRARRDIVHFITLAERLGSLHGQLLRHERLKKIHVMTQARGGHTHNIHVTPHT